MTRLTFRDFYKTAPAPKRMAMNLVVGLAAAVTFSSLSAISMILRQVARPVAEEVPPSGPRMPAALAEFPPYTFRFELPNFSVSLPTKGKRRTAYAQFSLVLDCPTVNSRHHLELNRARLRDAVLSASLPFGEAELRDSRGIARYKAKLLAELRTTFGNNAPRDLSLENFLVH